MDIANNVLVTRNLEVKKSYKILLNEHFRAEPIEVDFLKSEDASKIANNWVANKTHNNIKELIKAGNVNFYRIYLL